MPHILPAANGGLHLTGAARLADIAVNPIVRSSYPMLADACALESAIDAGVTLSSSLVSSGPCSSSNADLVTCVLNGTSRCAVIDPSAPLHAIIGGGPCWRAYASRAGVVLDALDAVLEFAGADSKAEATVVRLTPDSANGFQKLLVASPGGGAGTDALSVAAVRRQDGDVRLVIGGVAPSPYRVYNSVEEEAGAGGLDGETIAGLADRALLDAEADAASAPRVDAAAALLRQAIEAIAAISS